MKKIKKLISLFFYSLFDHCKKTFVSKDEINVQSAIEIFQRFENEIIFYKNSFTDREGVRRTDRGIMDWYTATTVKNIIEYLQSEKYLKYLDTEKYVVTKYKSGKDSYFYLLEIARISTGGLEYHGQFKWHTEILV